MSTGYTFVAFTPTPTINAAVPLLLFQSGHGSSAKCHEFLLKKIAQSGYVVLVPQHPNDTGSQAYGKPPNRDAAAAVFGGHTIAELQTDGTHLAAALAWMQHQPGCIIVQGQMVDTSKIVVGGFSAGCLEAINCAAHSIPGSISGLVCISPSTLPLVEVPYKFKRSDILQKVTSLSMPSLWITSEEDMTNMEAVDMFKSASSSGSVLVSFNDDILDLSMKVTSEFSIWSAEMAKQNPGLAAHMALACEEEVVADVPIVSFMRRAFGVFGSENEPYADDSMALVLERVVNPVTEAAPAAPTASNQRMVTPPY